MFSFLNLFALDPFVANHEFVFRSMFDVAHHRICCGARPHPHAPTGNRGPRRPDKVEDGTPTAPAQRPPTHPSGGRNPLISASRVIRTLMLPRSVLLHARMIKRANERRPPS
jgi:hypothetical protein